MHEGYPWFKVIYQWTGKILSNFYKHGIGRSLKVSLDMISHDIDCLRGELTAPSFEPVPTTE